jgi:hypothetical protein
MFHGYSVNERAKTNPLNNAGHVYFGAQTGNLASSRTRFSLIYFEETAAKLKPNLASIKWYEMDYVYRCLHFDHMPHFGWHRSLSQRFGAGGNHQQRIRFRAFHRSILCSTVF